MVPDTGDHKTTSRHSLLQCRKIEQIWNMRDGTQYWDTNNNGKPDYHTKLTTDGHFWGNDGSGWTALN